MAQRPTPLLEILQSLGFNQIKHREYVGKKIKDLNLNSLPENLMSLRIASIKKKSGVLNISLSAENYSQILEAHTQLELIAKKLKALFNRPCKIKLTVGQH